MATYRLHCRVSPHDYDHDWVTFFEKNNVTPEIYLGRHGLEEKAECALNEMAEWLVAKNIRPSVHAPFGTSDPVLFDSVARNNSQKVTDKTIALIRRFNAEIVVCHPVFEKYRNKKSFSKWIDENVSYFDHILAKTKEQGTVVAVENIYDEKPDYIVDLMGEVESQRFKLCFDVGHFNRYSKVGLGKWFKYLGDRICEIHVHDNFGEHDEHLPPGEGNFPFKKLIEALNSINRQLIITIEPLSKNSASRALVSAKRIFGIK